MVCGPSNAEYHERIMRELKESVLQERVLNRARYYGWRVYHTRDSRGSHAGWPDLVLLKGARLLFVELKSHKGRLSPEQTVWLAELAAAGQEVAVWRPMDLDTVVEDALGPKQQRLVYQGRP